MQFTKIPGHYKLKERLMQLANNSRIAHAFMLNAAPGSGALALGLAFVQYLFCENKGMDSCGECGNCIKINKLQHPDVHFAFPIIKKSDSTKTVSDDYIAEFRKEFSVNYFSDLNDWLSIIKAENKQPIINVAQSEEINRKLTLKSFEGGFKVMFIWLPEFMNDTASNKLLKLLEEPPAFTLFILVSENKEKLLQTIISRTQIINVNAIDTNDLAAYLMENYHLEMDKALELSILSDGSINEAVQLISESKENTLIREEFRIWMRALKRQHLTEIVNWCDSLQPKGREWQKNFLKYALHIFRESMMLQEGSKSLLRSSGSEAEFLSKFYPFVLLQHMDEYIKLLNDSIYAIERNGYGKLVFANLSLKLMRLL